MKYLVLLPLCALLAGCGDNSTSQSSSGATNASSGGSLITAPLDYVGAAGRAQQSAVKTVDLTSLNQAIQLFNVDKGRNPKDLNELVQAKFIPQIPPAPIGSKIVYDAESGKVSVVKQ